MDPKQIVILVFQLSIVCTVLGFGLHASRDDLQYLYRRRGLLVKSVLAVMVVMPLVAVAMARLFEFKATAELALIALALSPLPPLLPTRSDKAGGEHAFMVSLLLTLSLVSIVAIPISAAVLGYWFDRTFKVDPMAISRVVMSMIVLPILVGAVLRWRWPAIADRMAPIVARIGKVLLPLAVIVLLAAAWRGMWAAVGDGAVFAIVAFVLIGLAVGHLFGRPDREHSVVLALASACRHPAIALSIASANFPDTHFGGTILLYVLVSAVVGVPYVLWHRRCEMPAKA